VAGVGPRGSRARKDREDEGLASYGVERVPGDAAAGGPEYGAHDRRGADVGHQHARARTSAVQLRDVHREAPPDSAGGPAGAAGEAPAARLAPAQAADRASVRPFPTDPRGGVRL